MDGSHVIEMSKPAPVVIGAASIIALAVVLGVFALRACVQHRLHTRSLIPWPSPRLQSPRRPT